jgi:hypothetical protein
MEDKRKTLTTRQSHPIAGNQSMRSVGEARARDPIAVTA